ncbi:MAG: hypothetical protein IJ093_01460 [Bacilli bacterium]|nr:hypothetical protein [Bacilli bacterium]
MRKMSKEEVSALIKAIAFLVIGLIIILLVNFFIKDDGAKASNKYVSVGNYLILQKTNTGFNQIRNISDDILDLKYTIMDSSNTYEDVKLQFVDNRWFAFDKEYNEIDTSSFRAATHGVKIKLGDYNQEYIEEDEYVREYLKTKELYSSEGFRINKVSFDFDNDGVLENIYTLNNNSLINANYVVKGFIFMEKNGKIVEIGEVSDSSFMVMEILDLNNDGKYEMIASNNVVNLATFDNCYLIYELNGDKWETKNRC